MHIATAIIYGSFAVPHKHKIMSWIFQIQSPKACLTLIPYTQEWRQDFSDRGADSSDEGTKIRLSGYCKYQNSPTK